MKIFVGPSDKEKKWSFWIILFVIGGFTVTFK
jgi:hypothetical protein